MDTQRASPAWAVRAVRHSPEALVLVVLAVTVVEFRQLGPQFFLNLLLLLCGAALIAKVLLLWGGRVLPTGRMVSGCVAGGALIGIAAAQFGAIAAVWGSVSLVVLLASIAFWRRSRPAEEPGERGSLPWRA